MVPGVFAPAHTHVRSISLAIMLLQEVLVFGWVGLSEQYCSCTESSCSIPCLLHGFLQPHCFVVTTRDVAAHEEFLLKYGDSYWRNISQIKQHFAISASEEEQRQLQRLAQHEKARLMDSARRNPPAPDAAADASADGEAGRTPSLPLSGECATTEPTVVGGPNAVAVNLPNPASLINQQAPRDEHGEPGDALRT